VLVQQRQRPGDAGGAVERKQLDDPDHHRQRDLQRPEGVSCTSASACIAVGADVNSVGTLVTTKCGC
jgi:hypothetical protein